MRICARECRPEAGSNLLIERAEKAVPALAGEEEGAGAQVDGEVTLAGKDLILETIFVGQQRIATAPVMADGLRELELVATATCGGANLGRAFETLEIVAEDEVDDSAINGSSRD